MSIIIKTSKRCVTIWKLETKLFLKALRVTIIFNVFLMSFIWQFEFVLFFNAVSFHFIDLPSYFSKLFYILKTPK